MTESIKRLLQYLFPQTVISLLTDSKIPIADREHMAPSLYGTTRPGHNELQRGKPDFPFIDDDWLTSDDKVNTHNSWLDIQVAQLMNNHGCYLIFWKVMLWKNIVDVQPDLTFLMFVTN